MTPSEERLSIQVYTLHQNSTVGRPSYKFNEQVLLSVNPEQVKSLAQFHLLFQQQAGQSHGVNAFARLARVDGLEKGAFITSAGQLQEALRSPGGEQLAIVRYTKAQARQLQDLISDEETFFLDSVLQQRRIYQRFAQKEHPGQFQKAHEQRHYLAQLMHSKSAAELSPHQIQYFAALLSSGVPRDYILSNMGQFVKETEGIAKRVP